MSVESSESFIDRLKRRLPEAVFEGVFVVLAVLIALGVDEYREGRAERELALVARSSVAAELRGNLEELLGGRAKNRTLLRDLDGFLDQDTDAAGETHRLVGVEYEVLQRMFLDRQDEVVGAISNIDGTGDLDLADIL